MVNKKNVLIVGGGGVGIVTAYALELGGEAETTLVLRSNFDAVSKNGISLDSIDYGHGIRGWKPTAIRNTVPNMDQESNLAPFDFVVVTTKNIPDVGPSVAELIRNSVTPAKTAIVLMQNGLNIEKPLIDLFPNNPILSGIQLIGATEKSYGVVLHDEPDKSLIGVFEHPGHTDSAFKERAVAAAMDFVRIYSVSGKNSCKFDEDVKYNRWKKLVYNSYSKPNHLSSRNMS